MRVSLQATKALAPPLCISHFLATKMQGIGTGSSCTGVQCPSDPTLKTQRMFLDFTFPEPKHAPASAPEQTPRSPVSVDIRLELAAPVGGVCLGTRRFNASLMLMPETPMHEDDYPVLLQNNVRFAGKVALVDTEPIPHAMHERPHAEFWPCILGPYPAHVPTAAL